MRYELFVRGEGAARIADAARAASVGCDTAGGGVDLWVEVDAGSAALDRMLDAALSAPADVYDPQRGAPLLAFDRAAVRARYDEMAGALMPMPMPPPAASRGWIWIVVLIAGLWLASKALHALAK